METTEIAPYLCKSDSTYGYLALPSERLKRQVTTILTNVRREIGDGLYAMSEAALHITLYELIQAKSYRQDRVLLYKTNEAIFKETPTDILRRFSPITVHFHSVEVSPQAIIIRGEDDGSFNTIRQRFHDMLPIPEETKLPPTIIHASIARFTKHMDLAPIQAIVKRQSIDTEELITEFKLVHTTVLPFNRYHVIRTYSLEGRPF